MTEPVGKFGRPVNAPQYPNDGRNYEQRIIPDVDPSITVSRDGDIQVNGKDVYSHKITKADGTVISTQMAIHLSFPDIPMRYTPTR